MSQALYRKYRPLTFEDVYGQDNIVNILKNQVENKKISHAYIFSGTRGTGKTTCAKIFSRAVNCLNPKNGNPCNECKNCRAVLDESTMDVIEMDAASNRRIDDIRQLRDRVIYPPTDLKYRVYIIDEAHMITTEGFNALLKIMEEPPKHLIFILATTEIEKIPDTILSRTQRFEFKKIGQDDIEARMKEILDKEGIAMEEEAIHAISSIAQGALRDALSLLDQVISIDKKKFTSDDISDLLGIFSEETKREFSSYVLAGDVQNALLLVGRQLEKGKDPFNFLRELINHFNRLLTVKIDPARDKNFYKTYEDMLEGVSMERLVNILDIFFEYENLIKTSDNRALLLRILTIRLCDYTPRRQLEARVDELENRLSKLEYSMKNLDFSRVKKKEEDPEEVIEKKKEKKSVQETERRIKKKQRQLIEKKPETSDKPEEKKADEKEKPAEKKAELRQQDIVEEVKNYLAENQPMTNIAMSELKDAELKGNTIIFYLTANGLSYSRGMDFIFDTAMEEFSKKKGKDIGIKFEKYENKDPEFLDQEKIKYYKEIFPEDKFEIKD